jgi:hypothetical protein
MNKYSSMIGGNPSDVPRSPDEIARRSICVFTLIEHAMTYHDQALERREWLERKGITPALTNAERQYLYSDSPTEQQDINATWLAECLCILLWSIGYIESVPTDSEKFSAADTFDFMPGYSEISVDEFIDRAKLRPVDELYEMARDIQWAHGKARSMNQQEVCEILRERHLAINWVVGYCGLSWDMVTADT